MILYRSIFPTRGSIKTRFSVSAAILALAGLVLFAIAFGTLIPPPSTAHADSSGQLLDRACPDGDPMDTGPDGW